MIQEEAKRQKNFRIKPMMTIVCHYVDRYLKIKGPIRLAEASNTKAALTVNFWN